MGMDFVEIAMRIEVVFHLRLEEEFYQSLMESVTHEDQGSELSRSLKRADDLTVGHLVDAVVRRLKLAGWYEEERTFDATLEELLHKLRTYYDREDIFAETQLESILVPKPYNRDWTEFTQLFPVLLPVTIGRRPQIKTYFAVILVVVAVGIVIGEWSESFSGAVAATALSAIVALQAFRLYNYVQRMNPRNRSIPEEIQTVQRLAEFVHRSRMGADMTAPWNEQTVWTAVQAILSTILAVPPEKVVPTARLIHDLGMD